jgi:hypothetical protein
VAPRKVSNVAVAPRKVSNVAVAPRKVSERRVEWRERSLTKEKQKERKGQEEEAEAERERERERERTTGPKREKQGGQGGPESAHQDSLQQRSSKGSC